jgi:transposase
VPHLKVSGKGGKTRCLSGHGIEAHIIHSSSVAVSREHKRAKTDRLDTAMLMRVFLGWLRGEPGHCGMIAIPTIEEEDAKRPCRERENLVGERTRVTLLHGPGAGCGRTGGTTHGEAHSLPWNLRLAVQIPC